MPESHGVLVGRRVEWDALHAALAGLELGRQGVFQIAGEQGIGKTRLLTALRAASTGGGHQRFVRMAYRRRYQPSLRRAAVRPR